MHTPRRIANAARQLPTYREFRYDWSQDGMGSPRDAVINAWFGIKCAVITLVKG